MAEQRSISDISADVMAALNGEPPADDDTGSLTPPGAPLIDDDDDDYVPNPDNAELEEDELEEDELDGEGDDDDDIRTIAQLADAIDVEPEFLYGIEIGMAEGEAPVPLGELKDRYQALVKENKQLQEGSSGFNEQIAQLRQQAQVATQVNEHFVQAQAELREVTNRYNEIDWVAYEQQSPGEAALARQKFNEAYQAAQGKIGQVQQYMQQQAYQNRVEAAQQLMERIPEWKDDAVREAEEVEIQKALVAAGYTAQQVQESADPIAIALMRELVQLRKKVTTAEGNVQKVKKTPQVLGGGGRRQFNAGKLKQRLVNTARETGRTGDQVNAAKAILAGGGRKRRGR